jgi:hypothetical protein
LEIAPKREEIMQGPGEWGLNGESASFGKAIPIDAIDYVESLRPSWVAPRRVPCRSGEFKGEERGCAFASRASRPSGGAPDRSPQRRATAERRVAGRYSTARITCGALISAVTRSPGAISRALALSRVTVAVSVLPPPMSSVTSLFTAPSSRAVTTPSI